MIKRLTDPVPPAFAAFAIEFRRDLIERAAFFIGQIETREAVLEGRRIRAVVERHTWIGKTGEKRPEGIPGVSLFEVLDDEEKTMKTSKEGIDFIARHEREVLYVYDDKTSRPWGPGAQGNPTIGIGHLVRQGETFPPRITHEQAMDLLEKDLAIAEAAVRKLGVDLAQHEFDALVSFTFNVGTGGLAKSDLAKRLKAGDRAGAAEGFMHFLRPPEIRSRREDEQALFVNGHAASVSPETELATTLGVQKALNRLHITPAPLVEDGIPGAKTRAAVQAFQAAHGLKPDGVVGPKTRAALALALAK